MFIQLFWLLTIGIPSLIWFLKFLLVSTWFPKLTFGIIILIAYIITQRMINMSVIKADTKKQKKELNLITVRVCCFIKHIFFVLNIHLS